jgi:hypothetical protein
LIAAAADGYEAKERFSGVPTRFVGATSATAVDDGSPERLALRSTRYVSPQSEI